VKQIAVSIYVRQDRPIQGGYGYFTEHGPAVAWSYAKMGQLCDCQNKTLDRIFINQE
jgi:hypothetical protein